jgi:hypothetical protein
VPGQRLSFHIDVGQGRDKAVYIALYNQSATLTLLQSGSTPKWHLVGGRPEWRLGTITNAIGFSEPAKAAHFVLDLSPHARLGSKACVTIRVGAIQVEGGPTAVGHDFRLCNKVVASIPSHPLGS